MTEVMDMPPAEALDRRRDRPSDRKEKEKVSEDRKRDRDSRERRDDRDDRPPRRGGDYPPRDYKRRHSPSPPPYNPRDRRHSPPSRRSPPYKRSRRDDGYDSRRGSPRGGFNPDDRRYGYDGFGGYDRGGMGVRGGYADERPHSRHLGRASGFQSGPPDWPGAGRTGFSDMGTPQREGLMTYKQFIQELEDDILPSEAERRYEEYRTEYINTQKRAFFEAHKDEDWLKDKYDPSHLEGVIQRRNENAKATAKEFLQDLQNGTLDIGPSATGSMPSSAKGGQGSDQNSDDDAEINGKRRRHGRGPAKENDLMSSAPKAPPVSSDPRRVKKDIDHGQALIRKLDAEKGIEENILGGSEQDKFDGDKSLSGTIGVVIVRGANTVKGLEGLELLDVMVTYLWRVHGIDYYGMIELKEPPKGLRHIRVEIKNNNDETGAAEWEKKLDSTWEARLQGQDPLEIMSAKEKLEAATIEALDPFVRKIRDEKYGWKYGCGAKGCTKLFHAAEFVHKHLKLRHPDHVSELTAKARAEIYYQNYMNDPDAPGSAVTTQQSGQRDKARRRKIGPGIVGEVPSGSSTRARDVDHPDRANRRENERNDRAHEEDRYDRTENSPSQDYQSIPGGQDVGHPDPAMFDPFGAGMHGPPPFGSDMPPPPPVLMPLPGAGPLGPFVPAPPEVTMRMLREQGGPGPFHPGDNNGGPRGRKGRSSGGPSMGGMMDPQIMLPSPGFRQDPRRIRNYQDLDVPEDEVTVIDYRSL